MTFNWLFLYIFTANNNFQNNIQINWKRHGPVVQPKVITDFFHAPRTQQLMILFRWSLSIELLFIMMYLMLDYIDKWYVVYVLYIKIDANYLQILKESWIRRYTASCFDFIRIDLGDLWRKNVKTEHDTNCNISNEMKMLQSLRERMNPNNDTLKAKSFIKRIRCVFDKKINIWWKTNVPKLIQKKNRINSYGSFSSYRLPETITSSYRRTFDWPSIIINCFNFCTLSNQHCFINTTFLSHK